VAAVIPEVVESPSPADVLEIVTRAVFQAGVSWAQIAASWENYRAAFDGFDPAAIAAYGESDVERVLSHSKILRVPRKVRATVANARALLAIEGAFGSFHAYAATFTEYRALASDMKARFSFLGDMNVWYVLFRCGEPVPCFEGWVTTIKGEHPRMREMVDLARSRGTSHEY
jgi:3-methyladenine DNA glycosylase Tag